MTDNDDINRDPKSHEWQIATKLTHVTGRPWYGGNGNVQAPHWAQGDRTGSDALVPEGLKRLGIIKNASDIETPLMRQGATPSRDATIDIGHIDVTRLNDAVAHKHKTLRVDAQPQSHEVIYHPAGRPAGSFRNR